jgi:biotin/methionine sulfoxide reductase
MTSLTLSHWGLYEVDHGARLKPFTGDPDPSPIGLDQTSDVVTRLRVRRPAIRRGWLEGTRGRRRGEMRGRDSFVEMPWDEVIPILAAELQGAIAEHGNESILGGSYGWASAGRFHHAQSQLHRFLNCLGGYVAQRDSYSHAAASVILPHIVGDFDELLNQQTSWDVMGEHTQLFVAFGGVPLKNSQVSSGGVVTHQVRAGLEAITRRGRIVSISPVRSDIHDGVPFEWIPIRPNTDVALMLGLIHTIIGVASADRAFLASHCVGFDKLERYVLGETDGEAKTADWAAEITGVPEDRIVRLACEMTAQRTMLNAAWALQRAVHGEQPYWCMVALASVLGQIGLPGGGFGIGYGAANSIGSPYGRSPGPTLPQGRNPTGRFIPVARLADMLLQPGSSFDYDGRTCTYPEIRLVYWAGGNPFHHHQDLNRLVQAWHRPDTIVSHEQYWTPMARFADIVLPATTTLERNDIGFSGREGFLVPMRKVTDPIGESRNDHEILAALADAMGLADAFTEGLDEMGWLSRLYEMWRTAMKEPGLPEFSTFWADGALLPARHALAPLVFLDAFRADPLANRLSTPSGKIELFSETIATFGYDDCPGHPAWMEATPEGCADIAEPLHIISHQPSRKLHSQLDHARYSREGKLAAREPILMHAGDAAARGLDTGDIVEVYNALGSCLAGLTISPEVMPGVAVMATGSWFDPSDLGEVRSIEKHGNPNVLTPDVGTSKLAQGCTAMSCRAGVRLYPAPAPSVTAYRIPEGIVAPERGGQSHHHG